MAALATCKDFRRAAVIGFDLVNLRVRIALGKFEDVQEVRAAPGVDALGVVADDHDVVMTRGEQVDEVALEAVGVLVFVHKDELEAALILFATGGCSRRRRSQRAEQVVKIHGIGRAFAGGVTFGKRGDLRRERVEVTVLLRENFRDGLAVLTAREKMSASTSALGKRVALTSMSDSPRQALMRSSASWRSRMVKSRCQPRSSAWVRRVRRPDGVKGAAPERGEFLAEQVGDAAHHFAGSLVREGQEEDAVSGDALFEQETNAIGEGAGLAGTGAGDHERRAGRSGDGGVLLGIEFAGIINMQVNRGAKVLQHVIARHAEKVSQSGKVKSEKETGWRNVRRTGRKMGNKRGITLASGGQGPYSPCWAERRAGMSDTKATTKQTGTGQQKLIYVVDDEPMLLELAAVILEPQGYAVKTFRDPELVIEAFKASSPKPDVVVTDYAMHSMNGMDLVNRLRAAEPRQKILLVSGTVGADVFANAESKPDNFLAKPYQAHQLSEAVKSLINAK